MIGGLLCGLVGKIFPQILFFGYETLNSLLKDSNALAPDLIISLLGVKLVLTVISAGSGLVGGTFAPSLFLGAMLGALFHDEAASLMGIVEQVASQDPALAEALKELLASTASTAAAASTTSTETVVPALQIASVPAYAMVGTASVLAALFRAPLTAS